jgi:hypothetical protein
MESTAAAEPLPPGGGGAARTDDEGVRHGAPAWGSVASEKRRYQVRSRIWYEAGGRECNTTAQPSPPRAATVDVGRAAAGEGQAAGRRRRGEHGDADLGCGRIVALHSHSATSYQVRE